VYLTSHAGFSIQAARVEALSADSLYDIMETTGQGFDAGSCRGKDAAEQIDDDACAIAGAPVRLEDGWKAAGLDSGGGQRPLSFEGPLQLSPLLRGQMRVHSVRDRDERNPVRDREQRQTDPVRGGRQLRRGRLVRQIGTEPNRQGGDPSGQQSLDVVLARPVAHLQQEPDRHQQLATLQPWPGCGQLGHRGGTDLAIVVGTRDPRQTERGIRKQRSNCWHQGHFRTYSLDICVMEILAMYILAI